MIIIEKIQMKRKIMDKKKKARLKKKGWKVGSTSGFLKDKGKPTLYPPIIPGDDAADKILDEHFAKKPLKTKKLLVNNLPSLEAKYRDAGDAISKAVYKEVFGKKPPETKKLSTTPISDKLYPNVVPKPVEKGFVNAYFDNIQKKNEELLANIKKNLPELKKLLEKANEHWYMEDYVYRYYHGSFKVYYTQETTVEIVEALKKLAPEGVTFNRDFEEIFKEGTGKVFNSKHNANWSKHTRPMLEVFFHTKFFLEMAVKYGEELKEAPTCLPSGWAALLYFFSLR